MPRTFLLPVDRPLLSYRILVNGIETKNPDGTQRLCYQYLLTVDLEFPAKAYVEYFTCIYPTLYHLLLYITRFRIVLTFESINA